MIIASQVVPTSFAGDATMTIDRLDAMRTFVAIVDAGSFSAAAKRLGVSVPAISRRLSGFEERLGTPLAPSHDAQRRVHRVRSDLLRPRDAHPCRRSKRSSLNLPACAMRRRGCLRVAAPSVFGRTFVAPVIPEFLSRYPRVRVDLSLMRSADAAEPSASMQPSNSARRAIATRDHGSRALGLVSSGAVRRARLSAPRRHAAAAGGVNAARLHS